MRILCEGCESAAAILFCAADEAALCCACDEKVHTCNKLASRHVRVGLADPSGPSCCDICENAPAFFYCEVDGSSLCLQCDMVVHVGGKRTHWRYLLLRQRVEFPGDKSICAPPELGSAARRDENQQQQVTMRGSPPNQRATLVHVHEFDADGKLENKLIDLNTNPPRVRKQASNNQEEVVDVSSSNNHEAASIVPVGPFKRPEKRIPNI